MKPDIHYKVLEVEPGASQNEIKQAYKDLAKVWHPDRFTDNPRLQQKAEEKLKQINTAYEFLKSYQPHLTESTIEFEIEKPVEVFINSEKLEKLLRVC